MGFFKAAKELGGFAVSLSSIFSAIFSLIKIIQRCSATIEFKTKLSPGTKELFTWATNLMETIFNDLIPLEHLTERDCLVLMGFAFYLSFPFLFLTVFKSARVSIYAFQTALFSFISGFGVQYLPGITGYILVFIYPIAVVTLGVISFVIYHIGCGSFAFFYLMFPFFIMLTLSVGIIKSFGNILNIQYYTDELKPGDIFIGTWLFLIVFGITSASAIIHKNIFLIGYLGTSLFLLIASAVIGKFFMGAIKYILSGFQMISSALIIPIITKLIDMIYSNDGVEKEIIIFVCVIPLFLTYFLFVMLTIFKHEAIVEKYRHNLHYFEIFDITCKYGYAFASGFQCYWACVAIEIVTLLAILVLRPYRYWNCYALNIGECIVVITANLIAKYYKGMFSFKVTMIILSLAVLPVIISLYLFFIFDFGRKRETEESEYSLIVINVISIVIITVGFFLYGMCAKQLFLS